MSCNSCENECVQTLNVIQSNFVPQDTNTVDLNLTGNILTGNVIVDGQGIENTASGVSIELDPNPCNSLTKSAAGLFTPPEHTSLFTDGGTQNIVNILLTAPGSVTYGSSGVISIINPSNCRSMTVYAFLFSSFSYITDPNVVATISVEVSTNGGPFVSTNLIGLSRNSAGTTHDSKSILNRLYITIAPSAIGTFELRQTFSYTSGPGGARITSYASGVSTLGITV